MEDENFYIKTINWTKYEKMFGLLNLFGFNNIQKGSEIYQ
jgi:hypothetical protein